MKKNFRKKNNVKAYPRVPYAMTCHGEEEIDAVVRVLKTSTQMGNYTRDFETKCAAEFTKKEGIMVNSGSSALYLAVEALNLPNKSEIITPALTFATTVGCIVKNGHIPVFVDVEPNTYNIDCNRVEALITEKTRALLVPNLMGNFPDWDMLYEISRKYKLAILEDSADIIGASYKGKKAGYYSDITTTSFYGMHVINCAGNGGMVCANDQEIIKKIKLLRSWGRSSSLFVESEAIENRFNVNVDNVEYDAKFVFEEIGYNLEGSEIGAAFGSVQLQKLQKFIKHRQNVANEHYKFLEKYKDWLDLPEQNPHADTCWFAFPMIVRESAPFSRRDIQIFLENRNIQTRVVFTGNISRQPGFKNIEMRKDPEGLDNTDRVMRHGFLIASHHGMTDEMTAHIHESFREFSKQFI